jgi:hypothetical protein
MNEYDERYFAYVRYLEKKNKELQAEVDKLRSYKEQIEVIDRKPVPVYEIKCLECRSTIRYRAREVKWESLTCPVCGCPIWVNWNLVEDNQSYIAKMERR